MYDLMHLMDRLRVVKHNPPEFADPAITMFDKMGRARSAPLTPYDTPVFVEVGGNGAVHAGRLVGIRFESHNGGICVVLSAEEADK